MIDNQHKPQTDTITVFGILIWLIAALFYSYEFFLRISPNVMGPDLTNFYQVSEATIGLFGTAYFLPYLIMQLPVGMALDRFSTRGVLTFAALIVALGCVLFASTHQLYLAIIGRGLMGVGSAFAFVGCLKLSANWFPSRYFALIVGLTNTLGVLGGISGQLPLAIFIDSVGWQQAMWTAGIIGLILAICNYAILRDYPSHGKNPQPQQIQRFSVIISGLRHITASKQSWLVGIFGGLMVAPIIAFGELWSDTFFETAHALTREQASGISSVLFIGIAAGGPMNGLISGLMNKRRPVMLMGSIGALITFATLLFLPTHSVPLLTLLLFIMGFFTSSMLLCFAINRESYPANISGIVIGFTNMAVTFFGGLIFQPLIGKLLDLQWDGKMINGIRHFTHHDFQIAFSVFLLCHIIAIICLIFIQENRKDQ